MCIAIPGRILSISEDNVAIIDVFGTKREAYLDLIDEPVKVGDYVICHVGYAIERLDEKIALEKLAFLKEVIENEIY
ncbi:MAG TPA: HypC/HybG/HupF family hydrogenase formation chaperone [Syntrophales bacterium]|nr:HypC/HybG/HupF family hydrogenase formation chaperone [Syntrophales bacterium]HOL60006.1 HypC/HybG/HupF family hydrogenase formation chaperone [Syntrophales bacterium]HPO36145.1 HypC/HybG/HupF family hydrogenase formation chaperone [Syntrophales bacterium]